MSKSDGSTADYYQLPKGATELQHLISHRNMNAQDGEIFRAIYRKGRASHSDELRDARKVLFYAKAEVERLENSQEAKFQERPELTYGEHLEALAKRQATANLEMAAHNAAQYTGPGGVMLRCPGCNPEECPCVGA